MTVKFIIGVDAALRNTGITVFDNTGKHIRSFNITTNAGTSDHSSIDKIVREFFDELAPYFTPELIRLNAVAFFIEQIMFSRNGDKTHSRAEVVGAIKWNIRQEKLNVFGVHNKAANSFLDGKFGYRGNRNSAAQKKHTMAVLHRHCNFYTKNDNIADSYVMGLFGLAYLIEKKRLTVIPQCMVRF